jgi:superfamily II helicase
MSDDVMKTCTRCLESLPLSEFYKRASNKTGFQAVCRRCHNSYVKQHRKGANPLENAAADLANALAEQERRKREFHAINARVEECRKALRGLIGKDKDGAA